MQLMEAAAAAKGPRFAFISVHDYGLPGALPHYTPYGPSPKSLGPAQYPLHSNMRRPTSRSQLVSCS